MAIELNEPVISALHQRLVDELPAAIAAANEEIAASSFAFELAEPDQVLSYIPPPSDLLTPPTIGIGDGRSTFEDDEGFSATGKHATLIVIYDQSSEQEALAWQLRRWAKVVTRIALEGRRLGDAAWGTGLIEVVPGPTLVDNPENPREWLSWVGIRIWAKRDEE
jgi:hypothetical protein